MPPESWSKIALGDYAKVIMGQSPESEYYTTNPTDMPFLQGNRTFGSKYPLFDTFTSKVTKLAPAGSVIVSVRAPVGDTNFAPTDLCLGRGVAALISDDPDNEYLYYLMRHLTPLLNQNENGSTFGSINRTDLEQLPVNLPDYETRCKIGHILSSIDSKIDKNQQINDNLFQQAEKLYRHTVESDNLIDAALSEFCDFQEGYVNPSQKEESFFDGNVKWLRAVDINESYIVNTSRTLTEKGFQSAGSSAYLFEPDSIVISKSGTIGRLGIIADRMCGNRAVIEIKVKNLSMMPFIYLYLKSKQNEFSDMAVGSVQKNLYVSLLEPMIVKIPTDEKLKTVNNCLMPIFSMIKKNCSEMLHLSNIRDSLLHKLMSGEIDVSTLEIPN